MPPGNLAAQEAGTLRIKPRVGIFFVDFSCGILAVAFGCAVLLFMSDVQLDPTLFGRSRVLVPYLLLGVLFCLFTNYAIFGLFAPMCRTVAFCSCVHQNRQGKISSLKVRGHIEYLLSGLQWCFLSMSQQLRPCAVNFCSFILLCNSTAQRDIRDTPGSTRV